MVYAVLLVTIGAGLVVGRSGAASNQDQCLENVGTVQTQLKRDVAAHTDARNDRFFYLFLPADAQDVARHHGETGWRCWFVGVSVTSQVDGDHLKEGGEAGDLVQPKPVVERVGMNEKQGKPFARNLVINSDVVDRTVSHLARPPKQIDL